MRSNRRKRVSTMWRVILVSALAAAFLFVFKDTFYRWKGGRWLSATTAQPALVLGALINGEPADLNPENNLVQGTTITPTLDIDWGSGPTGSVELTFLGRVIPANKPITLTEPGSYSLAVEAHTERWTRTRTISFEVTEYPRIRAQAVVDRFDREPFELIVRLSGDAFDEDTINPATLSIALLDARNKPIERLPIAMIQTGPDAGPDARLVDGSWILRFARIPGTPAQGGSPVAAIITGSGLNQGQLFDIVANTSIPALAEAQP